MKELGTRQRDKHSEIKREASFLKIGMSSPFLPYLLSRYRPPPLTYPDKCIGISCDTLKGCRPKFCFSLLRSVRMSCEFHLIRSNFSSLYLTQSKQVLRQQHGSGIFRILRLADQPFNQPTETDRWTNRRTTCNNNSSNLAISISYPSIFLYIYMIADSALCILQCQYMYSILLSIMNLYFEEERDRYKKDGTER